MKIAFNREKFQAAFQTAAAVAPARSPKPILQNVKLEVTAGGATLSATDMELGVRVDVEGVEVEKAGSAVLPKDRFTSILRESSDETLTIETDEQGAIVKGDRSKFRLPSENPEEFPDVAKFAEEKYHTVTARVLRELIRRTVFATDVETARYALGGVLLEFEPDKIVAVGTDSRRLAKMEGPATTEGGHESGDVTTIVPSKAMQVLERSLTNDEANVQIAARGNDILILSDRVTLYSRLVEGRFPKWRDVIPKNRKASRVEMTAGPLHSIIRQAAIVATNESRGIDFNFEKGSLVLTGATSEIGESRVEMPVSFDDDPTVLRLDHRFVSDFLRVLDPGRSFTFEVEDGDKAALLSTDDGYDYVIMPLKRDV